MQATITFCLTEAAQRAQMASTGLPVARIQTVTEELPADLLAHPITQVDAGGACSIDLTKRSGFRWNGDILWQDDSSSGIGEPLTAMPATAIDAVRERIAAVEAAKIARQEEAQRKDAAEKAKTEQAARERAEKIAARQPAIDAFLAGDQLADKIDGGFPYWITLPGGVTVHRDIFGDAVVKQLAQAHEASAAKVKAAKEAAEAVKEQAKLDYLALWIAAHGTDSQKARSRDGLLCRDEAINALSDATFAGVNGMPYTSDSRPIPDCNSEICDGAECATKHSITEDVSCLGEREYERLSVIKASITATFVLRKHEAVHDCDHSGCTMAHNHGVLAKVKVGPFLLQREYAL